MTSRYTREQARKILTNAIKVYLNKKIRRKKNGTRLDLTSEKSRNGRIHRDLVGMT